jgi:hypothetical protein
MYTIVIQLGAILCVAGLFLESDPEISLHLSARREREPQLFHSSARAHNYRVRYHGRCQSFLLKKQIGQNLENLWANGVGFVHRLALSCGS